MDEFTPHTPPTLDELRAYQAGQLSDAARHRVERLLLENPFYADALDGLDALQQAGASLPDQTARLREALYNRVHESANQRRLWPLWITSLAASILLVMSVALYLILFQPQPVARHNKRMIEVEMAPKKQETAINTDSVTAASPATRPSPPPAAIAHLTRKPARQAAQTSTEQPAPPVAEWSRSGLASQPVIRQIEVIQPDLPVVPAQVTLTGLITDSANNPLPGVSILVPGTQRGVSTDAQGRFQLDSLAAAQTKLTATYVGFKPLTFSPTDLANGPIKLAEDSQSLNEVVVVNVANAKRSRTSTATPVALTPLPATTVQAFRTFVEQNRQRPVEAIEEGVYGTVTVQFVVQPNGAISSLRVTKSLGHGCDEEATRLIRAFGKWPIGSQQATVSF